MAQGHARHPVGDRRGRGHDEVPYLGRREARRGGRRLSGRVVAHRATARGSLTVRPQRPIDITEIRPVRVCARTPTARAARRGGRTGLVIRAGSRRIG